MDCTKEKKSGSTGESRGWRFIPGSESCSLAREVLVVMPELDVAGGREMGEGEEGRGQRGGRSQMWARERGCLTAGATGA